MTNLKNFAAQQLTKKQMNDVKGGVAILCPVLDSNGNTINYVYATAANVLEATQNIVDQIKPYGGSTGDCEFV